MSAKMASMSEYERVRDARGDPFITLDIQVQARWAGPLLLLLGMLTHRLSIPQRGGHQNRLQGSGALGLSLLAGAGRH